MRIAEAIAAIEAGSRVKRKDATYWLEADAKGRPCLMIAPRSDNWVIKHAVISSEHFGSDEWEIVK